MQRYTKTGRKDGCYDGLGITAEYEKGFVFLTEVSWCGEDEMVEMVALANKARKAKKK